MMAFRKKCKWAVSVCSGIYQLLDALGSIKVDEISKGRKIIMPLSVAKKSTGITALSLSDHFFDTS